MQKKDRLDIVFEDKSIIIINKKPHILTVANNKNEPTLYHEVLEYLHKKNQKVFIVHRLDKDTSGLIVFAKNERVQQVLQDNWDTFTREYIAVVEGKLKEEKGTLKDYLAENSTLMTYVTTPNKGKLAITHYEVIKNASQSILKINIETGRKNQIRCSLANLGHPIIGDKKYGAKTNPLRRLCLHANHLIIKHPITNQIIDLKIDDPSEFKIFK